MGKNSKVKPKPDVTHNVLVSTQQKTDAFGGLPFISTNTHEWTVRKQEVIVMGSTNAASLLAAKPRMLDHTTLHVWHKVIVKTPVTNRMAVIKAINTQISPLTLIPFFIELILNLHAKTVNLSEKLQNIVSKRIHSGKKFLNFSYLRIMPEFQEIMYDLEDVPHFLQLSLKIVSMTVTIPDILALSLAGNKLSSLSCLKDLFSYGNNWKSLKILDLTDNQIPNVTDLLPINHIQITELYLHKNPACGKYIQDTLYSSVLRTTFPKLRKLDGTFLQQIPIVPYWQPNYIFCASHSDAGELADQFIKHFFTLYDGENRIRLCGLYHENAYFSLSSTFIAGQSTSTDARLTSYFTESRNLLQSTTSLKTKAALSHGEKNILTRLKGLPRTNHDQYSFTVDLLHHSLTRTVLTVTGVFREPKLTGLQLHRHFMRTFVLLTVANDEYKIVNDIMYVSNATSREVQDAFIYKKPLLEAKKNSSQMFQLKESEKICIAERFSHLTGLTLSWSHKYLCATEWNIRKALLEFIDVYNANKIPDVAFKIQKRPQAVQYRKQKLY